MHKKTCRDCRQSKPIDSFYRHPNMSDGFLNVCKACKLSYAIKYRDKNKQSIIAKDRARNKLRTNRKANLKVAKESARRYRQRNPEKIYARGCAARAIRAGNLKRKECEICGNKKTEAHHPNYSEPLSVKWLCRQHHLKLHEGIN